MGLLEELAEFKAVIKERGLSGSVSSTTYGYVYNQPFFTENLGENFDEALEKLKSLDIPS
jgi:hypothetical protein